MILHNSVECRNARLDAEETTIGTAPIIRLRSGSVPASTLATLGTIIAEGILPSDWLANAASGVKSKSGTWTLVGVTAAGSGTAATHYTIHDSADTKCHELGDVTVTGGGGAMTVDNTSVANAQVVTVSTYAKTAGNA